MSGFDIIARGIAAQNRAALGTTQSRLRWWARSYTGVRPRFPVMAAPPTITVGTANATVNANTGYSCTAQANSGRIVYAGPNTYVFDGSNRVTTGSVTTNSDNTANASPIGVARFMTEAPAFELPFRANFGQVNITVDDEFASRTRGVCELPVTGAPHQVKVDFGANTRTQYLIGISRSAAGSGYAVGDRITLAGGTGTPAVVTVTQAFTGGADAVAITTAGSYSATPSGTITQASTTGSGTGATFTSPFWASQQTTRRLRRVRVIWTGYIQFAGVNVAASDNVLPWPVSPRVPRMMVVGDSQQDTFVDYAGGQMGYSIAQHLGLADAVTISSYGGTGYLSTNGIGLNWTDARRIADIIRQAPDIVLIIGSQNDWNQNTATLTAAVRTMLNTLLAALPNTLFVGIGPVVGNSSTVNAANAIAAGWTGANDQGRVRFIDNFTVPWITGFGESAITASPTTNAGYWVASEQYHLHGFGVEYWAEIAATRVGDALLAMLG